MNERGFFTLIGICFLLIATICVKGIKDFGKIYADNTANLQIEHELQNIADSALIEAAEKIYIQPELLPDPIPYTLQKDNQYQIFVSQPKSTARLENVSVEVYGERGNVYQGKKNFLSNGKFEIEIDKNKDNQEIKNKGIILMSIASCDEKIFGGKMYRRSFAYILENDEKIYYLNDD